MMIVKKDGEAVSQERIVGNGGLKQLFLHITGQVRPELKRCMTQQQLKFVGQTIHVTPLAHRQFRFADY
jgi:hypothetical protein